MLPSRPDPVTSPAHYTSHPSGIECIQITEHMGFNLGNAIKYIWRADLKDSAEQDLRKAIWYIERELSRRGKHLQQCDFCVGDTDANCTTCANAGYVNWRSPNAQPA